MFSYQNLCLTLVLLLCVELHIASGDTFYIVTLSDSLCPGEFTGVPCLTLQDYASNPSRSENITLIVEPGAYNLSTVLTVSNGYNFTMSSTNTTVTCTTTNARFTFDTVENVHISGMTFQGCNNPLQITGGSVMVQISRMEFERCSGTAVQITDGELVTISEIVIQRSGTGIQMTRVVNAILTNSSFVSNNGGAIYASTFNNFTIAMSNFSNNGRTYSNGGAIYVANSGSWSNHYSLNLRISGSVFTSNTVRTWQGGGAIYVQIQSESSVVDLTIERSVFTYNSARRNNYYYYRSYGGAININILNSYRLTTTISNSSFSHNTANGYGGALYMSVQQNGAAEDKHNLSLTECEFINNTAGRYAYGGAVYTTGNNGNILVYHNTFQKNTGNNGGGALYIYGTSNLVNLTVNSFISNTARTGYGGVVYKLGNNGEILIHQNSYHNNSALYNGGALFVSGVNSPINVINSSFINNTCTTTSTYYRYSGGAIYKSGNNGGMLANHNQFHNNRANSGGALYVQGDNSPVSVTDNLFINNTAVQNGGAIYKSGNTGDILSQQNDFHNNTAGQNGGAIYKSGNSGDILSQQNDFHNNTAGQNGGAIYKAGSNVNLLLEQNYYHNNTANTFGGAVYGNGANSLINATSSSFINNMATTEGGGAIFTNGLYTNVTLSSSIFDNNSASYCGVLDVDNYEHVVNLTNSVFIYNHATTTTATTGGGVACIRNASINIINSTFRHNVAENHAGVLFIDESLTTIDRSSFINNTAALDGGVFYTYVHASDYVITRSQFSENSAGDDGGVIFIGRLNSFVFIDESLFDFNSAVDRGGVIAIIASTLHMEINRTNIYNNSAQYGGVISACNSQITFLGESLNVTADPVLSFCMLYGGDIYDFNITLPPDPVIPTQPPITTELVTTESETTQPDTTQPETTMIATTEHVSTQKGTTQMDAVTTEAVSTEQETTQIDTVTTQTESTQPMTTQVEAVSTQRETMQVDMVTTVETELATAESETLQPETQQATTEAGTTQMDVVTTQAVSTEQEIEPLTTGPATKTEREVEELTTSQTLTTTELPASMETPITSELLTTTPTDSMETTDQSAITGQSSTSTDRVLPSTLASTEELTLTTSDTPSHMESSETEPFSTHEPTTSTLTSTEDVEATSPTQSPNESETDTTTSGPVLNKTPVTVQISPVESNLAFKLLATISLTGTIVLSIAVIVLAALFYRSRKQDRVHVKTKSKDKPNDVSRNDYEFATLSYSSPVHNPHCEIEDEKLKKEELFVNN